MTQPANRTSFLFCRTRIVIEHPLAYRFGHICGLSNEPSVWLRLNKMLLFWSRVSPKQVLFSSKARSDVGLARVNDLLFTMFFVVHICACTWYCIGRLVPAQSEGGPVLTWINGDKDVPNTGVTFDQDAHFALKPSSTTSDHYLVSVYWVAGTITANALVGEVLPQNQVEIIWTIFLMILNMTLFRSPMYNEYCVLHSFPPLRVLLLT